MFYVPITLPRQQLYTLIHVKAKGQGQQQITIPKFSSPEVLQILPPLELVEGSHPWWLLHFLYLILAIFMTFLGDRYGFSPMTQGNFYYAPPTPQPQTQDSGPPNEGLFNPFNSVPPMDMNDHLNMEKDLKIFVYPGENGFKIPREDNNVAYFVKNLYRQSPYPHRLSKFAINVLKSYF